MPEGRDVDGGAAAAHLLRTPEPSNTANHKVRAKARRTARVSHMAKAKVSTPVVAALARNIPAGESPEHVPPSVNRSAACTPRPWTTATALC